MPRPIVSVALLGVGEHERRVLLAAFSAVSGPALLSADLQWGKVDDADIVIADVDHPHTPSTLDGLQQMRPREVIRFAAQARPDVDIARPIRMQSLLQILQAAIDRIQSRAQAESQSAAARHAAQMLGRRAYRGVLVDTGEPSATPDSPAEPDISPKPKRTYRGQSY